MVGRLTMVRKSRYAGALGALPEAVEGLRSLAAEELTSIGRGVFTLTLLILLMAEILHQLRLVVYPITSQVVQNFFHQQYFRPVLNSQNHYLQVS